MTSPRLYDDGVSLFSDAPLPDLMGVPRAHAPAPLALPTDDEHEHYDAKDTITGQIAERLRSIGDRHAHLLEACARGEIRCGRANFCGRCGRRAAIKERRSIEAEVAGCALPRVLVTRTIAPSGSIDADRRLLLGARRQHVRLSPWRSSVAYSRGRVEVAFGPSGPMVHAHELALVSADLDVTALERSWARLLGEHGATGSFDVSAREVAPRRGFRSGCLLRDEARALRAPGAHGRRASSVGGGRARKAHGRAVGTRSPVKGMRR